MIGVVLGTNCILAQSGAGVIQGTVADQTGAVIPRASVHVVNQATAIAHDTVSNGAGFYSVPGLFAGGYTVTFSAQGMKQYETVIDLQAAQTAVLDPKLSVGTATQQVTVIGNTIQLADYDNGTVSTDLDNARINQIPENGRSLTSLAGMATPGLESGGSHANGLLQSSISYVQDGAQVNDREYGGPLSQADPDAVQEVNIDMSVSSAEYEAPSTAVITTKSGTNQLHGSFFETAVNNGIGIARSRSNSANFVQPHYVRNEFGASLGGPIVLPKLYHGKNKSFFFFAYERYSLRSGTYLEGTVPTQAMRQGDFSGLVNGNGQLQTLYDPATTDPTTHQRQPFPNNQIPQNRISALAKALYPVIPLPTNSTNPLVAKNLEFPGPNNTTAPNITFRLDHTFNENNTAYLRYTSHTSTNVSSRPGIPPTLAAAGFPLGLSNDEVTLDNQYDAALGFTHIFSPTFVSETVLGSIWAATWYNIAVGEPNVDWESKLGVPNNFGEPGMVNIGGPVYQFTTTQNNYGGPESIIDADENLTKTIAKHQLHFGGRYQFERISVLPDRNGDQVNFNGYGTALVDPTTGSSYNPLPNTGNKDADFLMGNASQYTIYLNPQNQKWHDMEYAAYLQDDWHLNSKLTINLGVRYEAMPVAIEANNGITSFDFNRDALVLSEPASTYVQKGYTTQGVINNLENLGAKIETPAGAGLPPHLIYGNNNIWQPRIGVAYAPFSGGRGTVFRAGFGRYEYPIPLRNFYASMKGNVPFAAKFQQDYTSGNDSPDGLNNYIIRNRQLVMAGQNSANVINTSTNTALARGSIGEFVFNPHYPPNMVYELNTTIEQPLKPDAVLHVSYVFDKGSDLDQFYNINNPLNLYVWEVETGTGQPGGTYSATALNPYDNTTWGGLTRDDRNGYSNYNALQVNYQRLYHRGYGYQLSYVFAKAFRVGGNTFRDSTISPYADYAPGMAPSSTYDGLNRFQNYKIDSGTPQHHISFNGVVDVPVGRGERYLGNVNKFFNELIGGYQFAFDGGIISEYFQPSSSNWGGVNPAGTGSIGKLHLYKKKYKITDCSSGVCYPGYLWFNGFISPLLTNNPCGPSLISGLPANYQPYETPVNMDPGTITCNSDGTAKYSNKNYLNNNVTVPIAGSPANTQAYSPGPGLNPFSKTFLRGPFNWTADASLFKVFPITERVNFRMNVDAFNVFNVQGYNNPSATSGLQEFQSSHNSPRQLQFTARLTF